MVLAFSSKKAWKFSWPFLNLFHGFFFLNYDYQFQEVFSELGIRIFLENKPRNFQKFLISQI
jgi:hypothetical protein